MCLMDWKLGRLIATQENPKTAGTTLTLKANNQRVGLLMSITETNVLVTPDSLQGSYRGATGKLYLPAGSDPYMVSMTNHGRMSTYDWVFSTLASQEQFSVTEFLLPEEYLDIPIEELRKMYTPWLPSKTFGPYK